jgi:hypothetical protein
VRTRQSNNPKRRIVPRDSFRAKDREALLKAARYVGSALHKRTPSTYGFHPPTNPRPHKSLCDDVRAIPLDEAQRLFEEGVEKGMVSTFREGGLPKYVWSVDESGEAYEAKLGNDGYHGYRLSEETEPDMRKLILREWAAR